MDTAVVLIVVAVVVLAAGAAAYLFQKRRSAQLQERFGPEYERTLEQSGDRRATERELSARQKRVAKLDINPITGDDARQYRDRWNTLQGRFVDDPSGAVDEADALVVQMMREAGYPVDDFDQRVDDISVDHPEVAQNYREAHDIAVANTAGTADTEQLRQAVTAYRNLVDVLLDDDNARPATTTTSGAAAATTPGTDPVTPGTDPVTPGTDPAASDGRLQSTDATDRDLHPVNADATDRLRGDGTEDRVYTDGTDADRMRADGTDLTGLNADRADGTRVGADGTDADRMRADGTDPDGLRADGTDSGLRADRVDGDRSDLGDGTDDGDHRSLRERLDPRNRNRDDAADADIRTAADRGELDPDQQADELADRRRTVNTDRTEQ